MFPRGRRAVGARRVLCWMSTVINAPGKPQELIGERVLLLVAQGLDELLDRRPAIGVYGLACADAPGAGVGVPRRLAGGPGAG
jgi:hypothetical protein